MTLDYESIRAAENYACPACSRQFSSLRTFRNHLRTLTDSDHAVIYYGLKYQKLNPNDFVNYKY